MFATPDYTAIARSSDPAGGGRLPVRPGAGYTGLMTPDDVVSPAASRRRPFPAGAVALGLALALPAAASTPEPPASDADADCYAAARDHGAAYPCDLAVQVARDPLDPAALNRALVNRALILMRENRLEAALADLDAALETAPEDARVYGNRGNLLLRLGRPQDALAAHGRAIELAPDDPAGYYNRAFVWRALGDDQRALGDVAAAAERLEAGAGTDPEAAESSLTPASSTAAGDGQAP